MAFIDIRKACYTTNTVSDYNNVCETGRSFWGQISSRDIIPPDVPRWLYVTSSDRLIHVQNTQVKHMLEAGGLLVSC